MSLEDTPEGIAGANAAASNVGVDVGVGVGVDVGVIGEAGTPFSPSTGTITEQEPIHKENAEDANKIDNSNGNGNGNGNINNNKNSDGNYSDADENSNPPSDDIATSAAKLGDDNDEGVADADAGIAIAEAMRTETEIETMPVEQSVEATTGMALEAETVVEEQQQQSFLQESNANHSDDNATMLQSGEEDQRDSQGEDAAGVFAGSTGEDSGDMNDEEDDDVAANRMVCKPAGVGTSTAATEFGAEGEGEGDAMLSMENTNDTNATDNDNDNDNDTSTTPTHRRTNSDTNRKKRLCRFPGCTRVIKSQGHCQRHGAKAKRCKVEGCEKQAQGTHNGMCKRHWRAVHFPDQVAAKAEAARKKELEEQPPPPYGESVYDNVLPASIAYRPSFASHQHQQAQLEKTGAASSSGNTATAAAATAITPMTGAATGVAENHSASALPVVPKTPPPSIVSAMPLVTFLGDGAVHKDVGWHRQAERRARGIFPCASLSAQLEPWEKQLALVEILLLSGGTPHANFKDLAHAWGRERGFHQVLAGSVCTRRGEVERKKRSDAGMGKKILTAATTGKNHHQGGGGPVTPTGVAAVALHNSQHQQQQQQPHRKRPKPTTIIHHQPPEATVKVSQAAAAHLNYQTPVVPWHQQAQQQQPMMDNTMPASNTINDNGNGNGNGNDGVVMTNDVGVVDGGVGVGGNNGGYHQEQQPTESNNTTPAIYKPEMT